MSYQELKIIIEPSYKSGETLGTVTIKDCKFVDFECANCASLIAEVERLETELIRARLQTARYAEAWSELGEAIGDAKRDLLGLKDKPILDVRSARGET